MEPEKKIPFGHFEFLDSKTKSTSEARLLHLDQLLLVVKVMIFASVLSASVLHAVEKGIIYPEDRRYFHNEESSNENRSGFLSITPRGPLPFLSTLKDHPSGQQNYPCRSEQQGFYLPWICLQHMPLSITTPVSG